VPWSERPARPARCRGIGRTTSSRLVPWRRRALAQEPELRQHAPSPRMIVRPAGRTRTAKECPASSPTCLSGLIRSGSRGRQRARAKHAPLGSCQASLTIAGASWGVYGSGLVRRGAPCVDQLGGGDLQVAPWHGPVQRRAKDVANLVCREKLSGGSRVLCVVAADLPALLQSGNSNTPTTRGPVCPQGGGPIPASESGHGKSPTTSTAVGIARSPVTG
jgi:hypothetical protein